MSLYEFMAVREGWKRAHLPEEEQTAEAPSLNDFRDFLAGK